MAVSPLTVVIALICAAPIGQELPIGFYAIALGTMAIQKAAPVITWAKPAAIVFGSALSSGQLNAKSSLPGFFFA